MIRSRASLYLYTLGALVFTVPWFFTPGEGVVAVVLGFPVWAFYAVAASLLYAVLLAVCIGRYWHLSAGESEDADDS